MYLQLQAWSFIIIVNAILTGYVLATATPLPTDAASDISSESADYETASDISDVASFTDSDDGPDTALFTRNAPGHFVCKTNAWESECVGRYQHLCERGTFANLGIQQHICDHDQCTCVRN